MAITIPYEIPFHDVDSFGIVWHGHYYKYFELARTALYRSLGFDIEDMNNMGFVFPVIESHCRYSSALKYGQPVNIGAKFSAWDHYIQIQYRISEAGSDQRIASGHTKQAVCDKSGQMLTVVPDEIIKIITSVPSAP